MAGDGVTAYDVQYWNGSAWVTISGGSVTGNNKVWRKFSFTPLTTTKIRVLCHAAPDGFSRFTEVEAWTGPSPAPRYNLALGATATASSIYGPGFEAISVVNGDRKGLNAGNNGNWNDAPPGNTYPGWLEIDFGATKTINEISVFTIQDNWQNPAEPTESMTFTLNGLSGYDVQYWNGSSWVTVPGGSVTGNNKVWRKFTFSPVSTNKIRVLTNASPGGYSVLTEVEAYAPAETGGSGGVKWLVTDHLGTPRMILDQTGILANVKRHDYLPFGEELFAPTGGRSAAAGYSGGDGVRQQFTQKERDIETGLDYFLARYYSSTQGRFTSPDEFKGGPDELFVLGSGDSKKQALPYADITQPQSLNKYAYVYNNPCRYIDPDGHCAAPSGLKPGQVGICVASFISSKTVNAMGVPSPGRGDGRGTQGDGGSSRVEVRVAVDVKTGTVTKTDDIVARSGVIFKDVGPQGTGGSEVSSPSKDKEGNMYFQIHQVGTTTSPVAVFGSIENHLNMVVTPDGKVGVTPSSTVKDYPSTEIYKYTVDEKGKITTTLILHKKDSNDIRDLGRKEKPVQADPK